MFKKLFGNSMFGMIRRIFMGTLTAVSLVSSLPMDATAAGTWDDGVRDGKIYLAGYMQVVDPTSIDANGKTTVKRFGCDIYTNATGYSGTYGQSIVDKTNSMIYDTPTSGKGYAFSIGDHVRSTYSGKSSTGYNLNNYGTYQLWTCKIGDRLQVLYPVSDGYNVKNWYLESIDTNAYFDNSTGFVHFSDGRDMDLWGTEDAQIDNTIMLTHCWPNAWGSYPTAGRDGRVIAVFRENHTLALDVYVKNDGTKVYGDYDLRTGVFQVIK
ncbi:MAG: hypothetical protein K6A72_09060 [Lachnospiraceae bacterium]|nr:hypothetical protein [Lachnospiraceae bacterium]